MPIGTGIIYNVGDLILSTVSGSGTAFLETKIAAATSSIVYFDSNARINSASLNSITVGTASYVSGSTSIITNLTASNISASGTSSFGYVGIGTNSPTAILQVANSGRILGVLRLQITPQTTFYDNTFAVGTDGGGAHGFIYTSGTGGTFPLDTYGELILQAGPRTGFNNGISLVTGTTSPSVKLRVAENGNVGIGTTSPSEKLHVVGNGLITSGSAVDLRIDVSGAGNASLTIDRQTTGAESKILLLDGGASQWGIAAKANSNNFVIRDADSTERFTILKSGGNVGIGTTSPGEKLTVSGSSYIIGVTGAVGTGTAYYLGDSSNRDLAITRVGAAAMAIGRYYPSAWAETIRFTADGNVGIGTTTTTSGLLSLHGTYPQLNVNNPSTGSGVVIQLRDNGRAAGFMGHSTTTARLQFGSGDSTVTHMTIGESGNVGIGTTSPGALLEISSSTAASLLNVKGAGGNGILFVSGSGNVGIGTTSPAQRLDVRGYVVSDVGSNAVEGGFYLGNSGHGLRRPGGSSNDVYLYTTSGTLYMGASGNSSQHLTILTGGNVGIGTTSPANKLVVYDNKDTSTWNSSANNNLSNIQIHNAQSTINRPAVIELVQNDHSVVRLVGYKTDATSYWLSNFGISVRKADTNMHQVFTAQYDGNIGIGSTTPGDKLDVVGNINIDGSSFYRIANDSIITAPSDHGLVAYYGFDEGSSLLISDKTGRNNTSAAGSLTYTTTAIRGTALDGFGSNDNYVVVPDSTDFDFGTGDFAVSLWCRPNSSFTGTNNTLIEIGLYTAGILIRPQSAFNTLEVYIQNVFVTAPTIVWAANVWYHIVVTRVSSVLSVYSNGTRISSVANSLNIQVSSAGYIGRSAHSVGQFFYGIIDEVKIYKGKGLDYGEVRGQYLSRGDSMLVAPIFSNTNGNVGIGTSSPAYKLDVSGSSRFGFTSTNTHQFTGSVSVVGSVTAASFTGSLSGSITSALTASYLTPTNSYTITNLTASNISASGTSIFGNVGIGSSSPGYTLEVNGTQRTAGNFYLFNTVVNPASNFSNQRGVGFEASTGKLEVAASASNALTIGRFGSTGQILDFRYAGTQIGYFSLDTNDLTLGTARHLILSPTGNVGIGTTSPSNRLEVAGSTFNRATFKATANVQTGIQIIRTGGVSNTDWEIYSPASSGDLRIYNVADYVTFQSGSGNVGIGTTSPAYLLHVNSTGFENVAKFRGNNDTTIIIGGSDAGGSGEQYITYQNTTTAASAWMVGMDDGEDFRFAYGVAGEIDDSKTKVKIGQDGNVGIGTTTPAAKLEISGSSNSALLNIKSPISGAILFVSGSGAVGINTSTVGAYTLQVNGSFAAETKSFVIEHPTKAGKKLIYGSLESPYHGIRSTGRDTLVNGKCKIQLPDYIYKLILHDSVNIQLTGIKCNKTLYVDEINIPENYFTIAYDKAIFESYKDYDFFWDFTGIRTDVPELITEL